MTREVKQHAYGDALLFAIKQDHYDIAKSILQRSPVLANYQHSVTYSVYLGNNQYDHKTYPSLPPLVWAVQNKRFEMISLLLEYNADPRLSGYPTQDSSSNQFPLKHHAKNALTTATQSFPDCLAILGERTANIEKQEWVTVKETSDRDLIKKEELSAQKYGEILKKLFDAKGYAQDKTPVETLHGHLIKYQAQLNSNKGDEKNNDKLAVTVAAITVLEKLLSSKSPASDDLADYAKLIQTLDDACTQHPLWNDAMIQSRSTTGKLITQVQNVAYKTSFAPPSAIAEPRPAGFLARFLGGRTANSSAQNAAQQPVDGIVLEKAAPK